MRSTTATDYLCSFTLPQIGWTGCAYPDSSVRNGRPLKDYIYCTDLAAGWKYYSLTVPDRSSSLVVDLYNLTDDADLFVRYGQKPYSGIFDCVSATVGTSSEQCTLPSPSAGQWWVGINNHSTLDINFTVRAATCGMFCDYFEDGVLNPNWTYVKPSWAEENGRLEGTPVRKAVAVATPVFAGCRICAVEAEMGVAGSDSVLWLLGWYVDKKNTMELLLKEGNNKIILKQRVGGAVVKKATAKVDLVNYTSYLVRLAFNGSQYDVFVDDVHVLTFVPIGTVPSGTVGLQVKSRSGYGYFDSIQVH